MDESSYEIVCEQGHYAGYLNGEFYCTGDTYAEVLHELLNDKRRIDEN